MNLRNLLHLLIAVNFLSNSIVQIINHEGTKTPSTLDQTDNMLVKMVESKNPIKTPSIYLLVYDSYVVNETMLSYGIDNQDQEQYLEGLGFKIYPHTYSIKSNSIPTMSRVFNSSTSYYGSRRRAVSGDGVVHNLLEEFGYKTYGIFKWNFFFRGLIPSYDYWFPGANYSASLLLTKAIFLGEFRFDIEFDREPREEFIHEKRRIFSETPDEPRFIYTHSDWPGHSINVGVCRPNEIELYRERLAWANIEMKEDLALVIENNPEAIVIVAGDHGPYLTKNCNATEDQYDLSEITRLDIQDRNGSFLAIKWPTSDFEVYDDISILQDLFPVIFAYILEDISLLQARIEPITANENRISGAEISDGIINGGLNDGEPLYLYGEGE
jgi:hypothetical protein